MLVRRGFVSLSTFGICETPESVRTNMQSIAGKRHQRISQGPLLGLVLLDGGQRSLDLWEWNSSSPRLRAVHLTCPFHEREVYLTPPILLVPGHAVQQAIARYLGLQ